jgi:tetratricopeptide (TPR) repeat protein
MQSELAQAIVREIRIQLTPQEQQRLANARAVSPNAYDAYLLANFHAQKRTLAGSEKAIAYFQEAIRIDPRYAQAYAGLASAYIERDVWGGLGIGKAADQVRANALKALELEGDLAEAHSLLGWIHFQYDWDWERTETELKRAIELNANLPSSYQRYAFFLQAMGRHQEALAAVHRAVELDPLSPLYLSDEGRILYRERDYRKSIAQYERALELDPGYLPALSRIAEAYEQLGNYGEALARAQKYQQVSGNARVALGLKARIYGRTGKRRQVEETLRTLKKKGLQGRDEYFYASIYAAMGDRDRAFAELERMVESRSAMAFVLVDPQLDPIRSDPRFQQILRRANLPS